MGLGVRKPQHFLQFQWLSQGAGCEHLRPTNASEKADRRQEALAMKATGASNVAIAQAFGVSEGAVRHWLRKAEA